MDLQITTRLGITIRPAQATLAPWDAVIEQPRSPDGHCLVLSVPDTLLDPQLSSKGAVRTRLGVMHFPGHQLITLVAQIGTTLVTTLIDPADPVTAQWLRTSATSGAVVMLLGETRTRTVMLRAEQMHEVAPDAFVPTPVPQAVLAEAMTWYMQQFDTEDALRAIELHDKGIREVLLSTMVVAMPVDAKPHVRSTAEPAAMLH